MATLMWGIPKVAETLLKREGVDVESTVVTDIQYTDQGALSRVFAEPVTPDDDILRAHPGTSDTVAD